MLCKKHKVRCAFNKLLTGLLRLNIQGLVFDRIVELPILPATLPRIGRRFFDGTGNANSFPTPGDVCECQREAWRRVQISDTGSDGTNSTDLGLRVVITRPKSGRNIP
jgi:hypothetical protein